MYTAPTCPHSDMCGPLLERSVVAAVCESSEQYACSGDTITASCGSLANACCGDFDGSCQDGDADYFCIAAELDGAANPTGCAACADACLALQEDRCNCIQACSLASCGAKVADAIRAFVDDECDVSSLSSEALGMGAVTWKTGVSGAGFSAIESKADGHITCWRNVGSPGAPSFDDEVPLMTIVTPLHGASHYPLRQTAYLNLGDIDGDGFADMVIGQCAYIVDFSEEP